MSAASLITDLRARLGPGNITTPESEGYRDSLQRWADSSSRDAAVVVFAESAEDVSQAIRLAVKHSVPLTTVCGGHSTSSDNSIEGGLVIDLRKLRKVTVDPDTKKIFCDGGCLWADIDAAAAEHSLATVGGTVNQTGVAGLTLGGGYGWLSGQCGLAIDNLISAEVVLADGRIVECNSAQESDLFWAIRGAGHAFGVVTRFTFQGIVQCNPVYGGMVTWPAIPSAVTHLVNFANMLGLSTDGRAGMMIGFTTPPSSPGKRAIFGVCFFNGPKDEGEALFSPLVDGPVRPLANTLESRPYLEMNLVLKMAAASGGRRTSKGGTFQLPLPPTLFQRVLNMYEDLVHRIPEAGESGVCLFEFYATQKICSVAMSETAFSNRGTHQNCMIIPRWKSTEHDEQCRKFAADAMNLFRETVKDNVQGVGEYINYDGIGTDAAQIFGPNYDRLRALKGRYDPGNVFRKRHGLIGKVDEQRLPTPLIEATKMNSIISTKEVLEASTM